VVTAGRGIRALLMLAMLVVGSLALGTGGAFAAVPASVSSSAVPQAGTYCSDGQTVDCIEEPRSIVKGKEKVGQKYRMYCVKNYHGHSVVKVVNEKTGQVVIIHTNGHGKGCTQVPVDVGCQQVTAHGPNQAGKPAHSSAQLCTTAGTHHSSSGGLPFTGSDIIIPGTIIGLVLIVVGGLAVVIGRRRRAAPVV
jgi:hypothetical protein